MYPSQHSYEDTDLKTSDSATIQNLEAAFAGESMAHIKYLYFAGLCRAQGDTTSTEIFEQTAAQEVQHAFGHLDLLLPKNALTPAHCLESAIEGETYEYSEMYPKFRHLAKQEQNNDAVREFDEQIAESQQHAEQFRHTLEKARKRFEALARVEERHAKRYRETLDKVTG